MFIKRQTHSQDSAGQPAPKANKLPARIAAAVCLILLAAMIVGWAGLRRAPDDVGTLSVSDLEQEAKNLRVRCFDAQIPNDRQGISATITLPRRARGSALVVLCHGFTGNRQGDGHFHPLALQLALKGVACVQLDFPGCGDSAEPTTDYTLAHMQDDITAAIEYMATKYAVDRQRVGLVGHSMGGRLASLYLVPSQDRCPVAAAALWSPANGDGLKGLEFLDIDDPGRVADLAAQAAAAGSVNTWGIDLSDVFFAEMRESHPNAGLEDCGIPLLLCYTGHEGILSARTVRRTERAVRQAGGQIETKPFADAGHNYISADPDKAEQLDPILDQKLRSITLDFLLAALQ